MRNVEFGVTDETAKASTMNSSSSKLVVGNSRQKPLVVNIEPWASDYTLLPGEELQIVAYGNTTAPWFSVVERDGCSQVYLEDTSDFHVLQNGAELKCGHNRQLDGG